MEPRDAQRSSEPRFVRRPAPRAGTCVGLSGLPEEYVRFMDAGNGGVGFVPRGEFIILWRSGEIAELNAAYEVERWAPGLVVVGSNGRGEAYAFDLRGSSLPFVRVPFVGITRSLAAPIPGGFMGFMGFMGEEPTTTGDVPDPEEVWHIHPVILGGDPVAAANQTRLTRAGHFEAVRYWNAQIAILRSGQPD